MPNFNQIIICGHIGNAEELKSLQNGTPVLRFSIAGNTGFGEKKKTTWYRCSLFGKQAQSVQPFILKGKAVQVVGEHSNSEWTANDGTSKYANEIRVEKVVLMGSKDDHAERDPYKEPPPASEPNQEEIPF